MPLLSDQDQQIVRRQLAKVAQPVTLLFFTQTIGAPETALIARQVIDEVAALSDLVTVEELNVVLEKDRAAEYGVDDLSDNLADDDEDSVTPPVQPVSDLSLAKNIAQLSTKTAAAERRSATR